MPEMQVDSSFSDRITDKQASPTGLTARIGLICCLFSLACLSISFCSPYWLQTKQSSESRFRNIGLWTICVYKFIHFKDDSNQVYSGCWSIYSQEPKYYKLREWITPPWFRTCQVLVTGCLMIEMAAVVVVAMTFLHLCPLLHHAYLQTYAILTAASMMFLVTMTSIIVGVVFDVHVRDRTWMTRPRYNFLSWGYGFMILSAIIALFAGLCLFKAGYDTYCALRRREKDYVSEALELLKLLPLSSECVDYGVSLNNPVVVEPGGQTVDQVWPQHPPRYSSRGPHRLSVQKPADDDDETERTDSAINANERQCDRDSSKHVTKASFCRTLSSTYSKETDQAKEFGFTIGPAESSSQKPATFGKSYDRRYSYSSSSNEDLPSFISKVERQY